MVPKSSLFIRIVAGAYVIYLGGKLISSSVADKPENYILFIAAGVIFAAIGLYWLVGSVVKMVKKEYRDDSIMGRMKEAEGEKESDEPENELSEEDELSEKNEASDEDETIEEGKK